MTQESVSEQADAWRKRASESDSEGNAEAVFKGLRNKCPTINERRKASVKNFNEF